MTLEILIAQYNETEKDIKPMLDSIALQQGIDFNNIKIIIANDGSNTILSDHFLSQYNYKIDYHLVNHRGLSGIRNFLLDHSTADYIMFCDADDMFLCNHALNLIFSELSKKEIDYLYPDFLREYQFENKTIFLKIEKDCQVHGKVLRRQYLIDNNIRWQEELITHDSRYFFVLCETCTTKDRIVYYNYPYYLWRRNNKSTTNVKNWHLKTYGYFVLSIIYLVEELMRRGYLKQAQSSAVSFIYLTYFQYNTENWKDPINKELVKNALEGFSTFYKKYSCFIDLMDERELAEIIKITRNSVVRQQKETLLETITFEDWTKKIESIYKNKQLK